MTTIDHAAEEMTPGELIARLWALAETWGPVALIAYGAFALLVLSFVIFVFIKVIRSMREMDADHREMRKRMRR